MKKFIVTVATLVLFFLSLQTSTFAAEEKQSLFGVGSSVQELGGGEFQVKTEGVKPEEGFVFTPQQIFTKENIEVQVTIKGQGSVVLRVSETDAKGQFIKEKRLDIELTEDWATYAMPFTLESTNSQIDVQVITKTKAETEFTFKNLKIAEE